MVLGTTVLLIIKLIICNKYTTYVKIQHLSEIVKYMGKLMVIEWMNIYFTEVFRLVHHFTCIYTSSWISHTSDSHKSFKARYPGSRGDF